jgi:hypothetical protein
MSIPGFSAEASLGRAKGVYRESAAGSSAYSGRGPVALQLRLGLDPDLGAYLRCKANGGGELVCRFFAGLPPFTIGGVVAQRT